MHHDVNIVSGIFCYGFVLCINGLGYHHRQPDLWKKIIEIYKAPFLKPVSSTADLETKNYTCVTGLVDLKEHARIEVLKRCQCRLLIFHHLSDMVNMTQVSYRNPGPSIKMILEGQWAKYLQY
jgi:hypothetical protein